MKKNWEVKKLGEVCEIIAGQSPEGKYYNNVANGLPFYQGKKEFTDKFIGEPTTWTTSVTKEAQQGDVLISVRAPVGPVNFSTEKICIGRGLAAIRASELIDREYLFNFFLKHEKDIVGNAGAVFNSINKTQIENILIPIPPLPEQQHIVAMLDEAFAAIARAKENAEKNLQNAREFFESYLQNVFANPGDGWEEKELGEVTTKIGSGATPKGGNSSYKESGISLVRSLNVYDVGFIKRNLAYIDEVQAKKLDIVTLIEGDVLLNITGASIARCCVVPNEILPARVNQHVTILRPKRELIGSSFLHYCLISKFNKDRLLKISRASGATREALTKVFLTSFTVFIPKSISDQKDIVAKLDAFLAETKKLEAIYRQKLLNLDELKKSILQKAFYGELTGGEA
jgi:type I restriction enzyme S subunit